MTNSNGNWFDTVVAWGNTNIYIPLKKAWDSFNLPLRFDEVLIILGLIVGIIVVTSIIISIFVPKKRKIIFHETKNKIRVIRCRYKKEIKFPTIKAPKGKKFEGWYTDKKCTQKYTSKTLDTKKNLKLYAKFVDEKAVQTKPTQTTDTTTANTTTTTTTDNATTVAPVVSSVIKSILAPVEFDDDTTTTTSTTTTPVANTTTTTPVTNTTTTNNTVTPVTPVTTNGITSMTAPVEFDDTTVTPVVNTTTTTPIVNTTTTTPVVNATVTTDNTRKDDVVTNVNNVVKPVTSGYIEEETYDVPTEMTIGDIYDELRTVLLGYERVKAFNKVGVIRKQFIAEMFEKEGKIYLYLAIEPELLKAKGYNVESFTEREFAIVPCKKVIACEKDYKEALEIISETMKYNNLVKGNVNVKKVVSDEQGRKSGFAFFVKNENVLTTADDYYKFLRAITNCYSVSATARNIADANNKMILKIFKKDDTVYLYLALDAQKEGLEDVSYDSNFAETPAMFVLKTAEDFAKANALIDKLMYSFEMEKRPERANFSMEETVQKNCGFGYRIRT